jgi:RimJ/RimL family protein N-acetyltransferase
VIARSRLRPIVGEQVRLRPFQGRDLSRVITWRRDGELRRGALWGDGVFGPREARRWLRAVTDPTDPGRLTFAVELRSSGRLVGLTNLIRIDRASGTAYFGVVIGEKDCWGRGVGGETLRLMLERAAALGLRKVLLEVAADNPAPSGSTGASAFRPRASCAVSSSAGGRGRRAGHGALSRDAMIVAINQPCYLPWRGFFALMKPPTSSSSTTCSSPQHEPQLLRAGAAQDRRRPMPGSARSAGGRFGQRIDETESWTMAGRRALRGIRGAFSMPLRRPDQPLLTTLGGRA